MEQQKKNVIVRQPIAAKDADVVNSDNRNFTLQTEMRDLLNRRKTCGEAILQAHRILCWHSNFLPRHLRFQFPSLSRD